MKMRKWLALLCALLLVMMTLQPVSFAKSDDDDDADKDEYKELSQITVPSLDKLDQIDLPTVLKRSLDSSRNLKLLALKLQYLNEKQDDLDKQYSTMQEGKAGSVHLPVNAQEFMLDTNYKIEKPDVWMGPVAETNTVVNQVVYGQGQIVEAINKFVLDSRDKLKIGSDQAGAEMLNTSYQTSEAREGIQLLETSLYVQLLSLKKQTELLTDYQSVLQKDLDAAKILNQMGMSTPEDIRTLEKALNKQKDDIQTARNNYRLALAQLAFDIGIEYNPDIKVLDIKDLERGTIKRKETEELLTNAYQMKIAQNNLNESIIEKQDTEIKNRYQEKALKTNVEITKEKILQARIDLGKKIEATYSDAQNSYEAMQTELRNNSDTKTDYDKMSQRYNAGVISKHDLNKFSFKLRQSDTMLQLSKMKFYVLSQKVAAMENGFIQ